MSNEEEVEYKSSYTLVFAINYLMQGIFMSTFAVIIPVFLIGFFYYIKEKNLTLRFR